MSIHKKEQPDADEREALKVIYRSLPHNNDELDAEHVLRDLNEAGFVVVRKTPPDADEREAMVATLKTVRNECQARHGFEATPTAAQYADALHAAGFGRTRKREEK